MKLLLFHQHLRQTPDLISGRLLLLDSEAMAIALPQCKFGFSSFPPSSSNGSTNTCYQLFQPNTFLPNE
jgi:hypothetical protein